MIRDQFEEQIGLFESNGWRLDEKMKTYLWNEFGLLNVDQWEDIVDLIIREKSFTPKIADFYKAKSSLKIMDGKEKPILDEYYTKAKNYYNLPDKLHIGGNSPEDSKGNMMNGIWLLEHDKELPRIDHEELRVLHLFARKLEVNQWLDICKRKMTTQIKMLIDSICKELKGATQ